MTTETAVPLTAGGRLREHLYVIAAADGTVKIGSSGNPEERLRTLQTAHAGELRILKVFPGVGDLEKEVHFRLARYAVRGEWFARIDENTVALAIYEIQDEKRLLNSMRNRQFIDETYMCFVYGLSPHGKESAFWDTPLRASIADEPRPLRYWGKYEFLQTLDEAFVRSRDYTTSEDFRNNIRESVQAIIAVMDRYPAFLLEELPWPRRP